MSHAGYASKSLVVFLKLAAMLRIVQAVQFIFNKLAALLRGEGSDEMRASEFIGARSSVDQHATQSPSDLREKLIRRRWLETGIKMWNPDHHGAGLAALNIQGRAELLPPKPGETLPGYDTLEFKIVRSYVNGEAANHIVCEGVVVDPPKRRAERLTADAAVAIR